MKTLPATIRPRLVRAMMMTSTTVLLLTGAVLVVYETISYKETLVRGLSTRAQILASNCTAALSFENPEDARLTLAALKVDPSTRMAALYDRHDQLFQTYPPGATPSISLPKEHAPTYRFAGLRLHVYQPVIENGRWLGTLYLDYDLTVLRDRLRLFAVVVLLALLGSILVAFALSYWLQRAITHPIRVLAVAARDVSRKRDYSIRANVVSDGELRVLTESFNEMLETIQLRDAALGSSEARIRAILESAHDGIVTMDEDGRILEFNPAAERLFGRNRTEAIGAVITDYLVLPSRSRGELDADAPLLGQLKATHLDRRVEASARNRDGREFPVEVAITPIRQEGPPMFTGFIHDISARKRAERDIRTLNADLENRVAARTAELEVLNRELESFSYSVSHDLRAPLRHVNGFADLLTRHAKATLDDKGKRYLANISDSAIKMGQLIDDLLLFSRMGRLEMGEASVDLNALIAEVRKGHAAEVAGRDIQWNVAPLPTVRGDLAMLRVVLTNLVSNAIKYSSTREHAAISIDAQETADEVVIRVGDNGVGFDMQYAQKLFGVFQRLHSPDDFEGTGIGLANVRRIVQRHGGRTWAEGVVDRGASFFFSLPHPSVAEGSERKEAA